MFPKPSLGAEDANPQAASAFAGLAPVNLVPGSTDLSRCRC
jgi:hypothetical protein